MNQNSYYSYHEGGAKKEKKERKVNRVSHQIDD